MSERGRIVVCRKEGERIFIGSAIELTLTQARSGSARIMVTAPKDLSVDTPGKDVDRRDRDSLKAYQGESR